MEEVYDELWDEGPAMVATYTEKLMSLGLRKAEIQQRFCEMRALQSERAGVSIGYLLSGEFTQLATDRSGKDEPTFIDLETAFWFSEQPIGQDIICPRDGEAGCALVDWIPREHRRQQTHFMSWTWKYTLQQVQSALQIFRDGLVGPCYFYVCFFVNNQFRMRLGSDNLEEVFEDNLRRIGKMVAVLDTWERPVYLTRIWTVFEQFVASKNQIEVQFVMPKTAVNHMECEIATGSGGIDRVINALSQVDSVSAEARMLEDEIKVKSMIQETVGFQRVDAHVTDVMTTWIGKVVEQTCRELLGQAREKKAYNTHNGQTAITSLKYRAQFVENCEEENYRLEDSTAVKPRQPRPPQDPRASPPKPRCRSRKFAARSAHSARSARSAPSAEYWDGTEWMEWKEGSLARKPSRKTLAEALAAGSQVLSWRGDTSKSIQLANEASRELGHHYRDCVLAKAAHDRRRAAKWARGKRRGEEGAQMGPRNSVIADAVRKSLTEPGMPLDLGTHLPMEKKFSLQTASARASMARRMSLMKSDERPESKDPARRHSLQLHSMERRKSQQPTKMMKYNRLQRLLAAKQAEFDAFPPHQQEKLRTAFNHAREDA
eukprot:s1327_g13.t1